MHVNPRGTSDTHWAAFEFSAHHALHNLYRACPAGNLKAVQRATYEQRPCMVYTYSYTFLSSLPHYGEESACVWLGPVTNVVYI